MRCDMDSLYLPVAAYYYDCKKLEQIRTLFMNTVQLKPIKSVLLSCQVYCMIAMKLCKT